MLIMEALFISQHFANRHSGGVARWDYAGQGGEYNDHNSPVDKSGEAKSEVRRAVKECLTNYFGKYIAYGE
jgi:hypothetical protein